MCTYVTENVPASGSAKGPEGWFALSGATVYFDHPFHAPLDHSLNIDFADRSSASRRVAVELSAASARALAAAILAVLDAGEASTGGSPTNEPDTWEASTCGSPRGELDAGEASTRGSPRGELDAGEASTRGSPRGELDAGRPATRQASPAGRAATA